MVFCPQKYKNKAWVNVNERLKELKGELEDKQAKLTLVDFLRSNIGITVELLAGVKLAPYEEINLKKMLNTHRTMCVWGRGVGKSYIAAIFSFLQCVFEPGSQVMVAGPTFRTSRFIFEYLKKIVGSPGAQFLSQCFGHRSERNDLFSWQINDGSISAIPLNGEKIRGFRSNVLVVDEYLLMPKAIIDNVLKPFLNVPLDIAERIQIRELEERYISEGLLREDQRIVFENNSKMVALSSASYTFENLYTTYKEWRHIIEDESNDEKDPEKRIAYFISQLSYEAIPSHMVDQSVIEEARAGGSSKASFLRENCAQFVDESDGYFSAKKMNECTLPDGIDPSAMVVGNEGKKYILGIDPSFSTSRASDFFAMALMELDDERRVGTLVHGYAVAGGNLKDHIKYLLYLLTSFDIEMIIVDNAGWQFIDAATESEIFKSAKKRLSFLEVDTEVDPKEYDKMLQKTRQSWSKESGRICFKQVPNAEWIRKANQHLQACIDHKRIWFASNVRTNMAAFEKAVNANIDIKLIQAQFETVNDLTEFQDDVIYQTKKQCALIELASTPQGTQRFLLPLHLRHDSTEKRARDDNYAALVLANWAVKLYYEMLTTNKVSESTFTPFFV
jgi:hypothetical protein